MNPTTLVRSTLFLGDVWMILKGAKRWLLLLTAVGALGGLWWRLDRPIMYSAEGAFRVEAPRKQGISKLFDLDMSFVSCDPTIVMNSRTLIEQVVRERRLQACLFQRERPLQALKDRLRAELFFWLRADEEEQVRPYLSCSHVEYPHRHRQKLKICAEDDHYTVFSGDGAELAKGRWGEPVAGDGYRFTLEKHGEVAGSVWDLALIPMRNAVIRYRKMVGAADHPDVDGLVAVTAIYQQPDEAAAIANELMHAYKGYMGERDEERLQERMAYLKRRQDESRVEMRGLLMQYADRLSKRATSAAFMGLEEEMKYMAERQEKTLAKLQAVELNLQQMEGLPPCDAIHLVHGPQGHVANELVAQLHHHQLQAALLDQSLRNGRPIAHQHQRQMERAKAQAEIRNALAQLSHPESKLEAEWGPLTAPWWQRMEDSRLTAQAADSETHDQLQQELRRSQQLFEEYLKQSDASLQVQQQLFQESAQDSHALDGLDQGTIAGLYLQYEKQQRDAEARLHQTAFLLDLLATGKWEGAGAALAIDPAMASLIERATALQIKIGDATHYSPKEVTHFQEEYARVGALLGAQLQQQAQLQQMDLELIQAKLWELRRLQRTWLAQRMELINGQINQCVASARHSLQNEQKLLKQQVTEMGTSLKDVPQQWVDEQEIYHATELSEKILGKTVEVAEGQMMAHHLEQMEARPLDTALKPLKPLPPHLLLGTLIGGLAGLWAGASSLIGYQMLRGLNATKLQLERLGAHVLGSLTPPHDVTSLRRAVTFLDSLPKGRAGRTIALLSPINYTANLAQILSLMGHRSCLIHTDFNDTATPTGLLAYLQGQTPQPTLIRSGPLDLLPTGGTTPHSFELLHTRHFASLLDRLRHQYDYVFLYSTLSLDSVHHDAITAHTDATLITITNQTIDELGRYIASSQPTAFFTI